MATLRVLAVVGWLLLALPLSAVPLRIACIGDSITEGSNLSNPSVESYPAKLQRLLGTNEFTVRNYGVSGRTLLKQGDYPYWKEVDFTTSHAWQPDVVFIQLGTNDSKPYNWRYGTNFISDYEAMITSYAVLTNSPGIILCTPCPVYGANAYDISPSVVATNIAPLVRDLATRLGLELVDLHTRLAQHKEWFPDNVHPNSKGTTVMAAVIYSTFAKEPVPDPVPELSIHRVGSNRLALNWPATARSLIPLSASVLGGTNTSWSVAETVIFGDGDSAAQTNTISGLMRVYRLWRP